MDHPQWYKITVGGWLGPGEGLEPVKPWDDWDPVMQDDYLAEIDLTIEDELVLEVRRQVLDKTWPQTGDVTHR